MLDKIKEYLNKFPEDLAKFVGGFSSEAGGILEIVVSFFRSILGIFSKDTAPEAGEGE